jgi:carbon monoxide dehydrogenase subunit G
VKVELADEFNVTTSPADTFAFLTDPERFALLLPYFKELKDVQPGAFTVGLEIGIPQVRGRVDVDVKLVECIAPERATYRSSGRHALGVVDSELGFSVTPSGTGSTVHWQSASVVNGTLASLAQGILVPLAKRQIKLLVRSCQDRLGAPS